MKKILLAGALLFAASSSFTETPPPPPAYCDCIGIGFNQPKPHKISGNTVQDKIVHSVVGFGLWLYYLRNW